MTDAHGMPKLCGTCQKYIGGICTHVDEFYTPRIDFSRECSAWELKRPSEAAEMTEDQKMEAIGTAMIVVPVLILLAYKVFLVITN